MKRMSKVISLVLALSLLFSVTAFAEPGFTFTEDELQKTRLEWEDIQADNSVITLSVGENFNDISFSWLSDFFDAKPMLKISKNSDMKDSENISVESKSTVLLRRSNKAYAKGLEENETYWYSYTENGAWSEPESFKIGSKDNFSFIFVSDSQIGRSGDPKDKNVLINDTCGWQRTVRMASERKPDASFILSAGDQTEHGYSLTQYKAFLSPKELRSYPLVNVIGNHDFYFPCYTYYSANPNQIKEKLASPAGNGFYFCRGDALFIILNSNDMYVPDAAKLIKSAIDAYPKAKWRIAALHLSAYSAYQSDGKFALERSVFAPLFDTYSIDLVLSGNDHMYSCSYPVRSGKVGEGTTYLQASSASGSNFGTPKQEQSRYSRFVFREKTATYSLLDVTGKSIDVKTYTTDGDREIDSFTLNKESESTEPAERIVIYAVSFIKTLISMFK